MAWSWEGFFQEGANSGPGGNGLGAIVGGLFGGSKKSKGPSFEEQLAMNDKMIKNTMKATMDAAADNGVHPLYALGAPLSPAINFTAGTDREGPNWPGIVQDMGQNIGRAVHANATKEERALGEITARQAVVRGDLENELLKTQIAQIRASMNPPPSITNNGERLSGQADSAVYPREIFLQDRDGKIIPILNPDAGDNDVFMVHDYLTRTLPADFKNMTARTRDRLLSLSLKPFLRKKGGK